MKFKKWLFFDENDIFALSGGLKLLPQSMEALSGWDVLAPEGLPRYEAGIYPAPNRI